MNRLTNQREAAKQLAAYLVRISQGYPRNIPEERYLKLAAYENTGKEPEEVESLITELRDMAADLYLTKKGVGTVQGDYEAFYRTVTALPNCNTCGKKRTCRFCVKPGETLRFNCPLFKPDTAA